MEVIREHDNITRKKRSNTTVGVAMTDKYPWTVVSIAEELGMPVPSFRAWKMKMEKEEKIAKPAINSLLCIPDPESKNRLLYSDVYLNKLKEIRGGVRQHRKSSDVSASSLQHAKIRILVPIFDENVAKFLLKKFGDEQGIQEYLKTYVIELVKPSLSKIEALKREYEEKMNELMGNA